MPRSKSLSVARSRFYTHPRSDTEPVGSNSGEANRDSPSASQNPSETHVSEELEDEFLKSCRLKGRWINIAITFGIDLQDVFRLGIRLDEENLAANDDDDDDKIQKMNLLEKEILITAYNAILTPIPKLRMLLPIHDDADPAYFYRVVNAMQIGSNLARSEAIRRVKDNMIKYLAAGPNPVRVDPNWNSLDKALHGLNHPLIGRLLIPADDLPEWDADPKVTKAGFNHGYMKIQGHDMPVFLYDDYTYDPEDPEKGLFQGPFLVCVLIDIIFGTTAVDTTAVKRIEQSRHHCVGEMYELTTISPQNIAYAAVVARYCLSSKRTWNIKDDQFNYSTFYQAIVMRLADCEDPWANDTLAWWNERIFGDERGKLSIDEENRDKLLKENWDMFTRRKTGRKAALKAVEAKKRVTMLNSPFRDETESPFDTGGSNVQPDSTIFEDTPGETNEGASSGPPVTPFTHRTPSDSDIDLVLRTPGQDTDISALTQTPPGPQTPNTPDPFVQCALSPLSNASEVDTSPETTEEIPRPKTAKRKRKASKSEQPKARPAPRVRRKAAQA